MAPVGHFQQQAPSKAIIFLKPAIYYRYLNRIWSIVRNRMEITDVMVVGPKNQSIIFAIMEFRMKHLTLIILMIVFTAIQMRTIQMLLFTDFHVFRLAMKKSYKPLLLFMDQFLFVLMQNILHFNITRMVYGTNQIVVQQFMI